MSIEVKVSSIHGKGVFARRRITAGQRIGRFLARRTDQDGPHVLWLEDAGKWRGYAGYGRLRFVNHHRQPNSEFKGLDLYALSTIGSGEEITVNYGDDWADVV